MGLDMGSSWDVLRRWCRRRRRPINADVSSIFQQKYASFKELLASNGELLNIVSEIEEKLRGEELFGMSYVRSQSSRAVFHALRMVQSLNSLTGNRYPQLFTVLDGINDRIKEIVDQRKEIRAREYILGYDRITKEMVDWVGGKNANLGEISSRLALPIPRGFAITTRAYEVLFHENDLWDEIKKSKMEVDPERLESVTLASEQIQSRIISAKVPPDLESAMLQAFERSFGGLTDAALALRSSAIGEDGKLSFAGQYVTFLNVLPDKIVQTYKFILASLYTPRAIMYRISKGIRDDDVAMSVACLEMVRSVASGVMYTRHPFHYLEDNIIINAVWGLGPYAVDGVVTPDTYTVAKKDELPLLETTIAHKPVRLVGRPDGTLQEEAVEEERRNIPCLSSEQIRTLAGYGMELERHYKCAQDVEWALDEAGRLILLQARPLRLQPKEGRHEPIPRLEGYGVLVEKGAVASPGVGCGPAFHVQSDEDLNSFPEGAVLVARHSQPQFVVVMRRARAIVTDTGSVTGHMASVAREFGVPTLLGTNVATQTIPQGKVVTVDAYSGRVYEGRVEELLALRKPREAHMKETPVYDALKRVAQLIVPLHLSDPRSASFSPEGCRTLHDIMRFVHELSYQAMFQISDFVSDHGGGSIKLATPLPLDLHVIDLGGGLKSVSAEDETVELKDIASIPFLALLRGMLNDKLRWQHPRPIEFKGLLSVMSEQLMQQPHAIDRFGDRSYALISDKYLNFSSRVGYHYSVLDSYCGLSANKNYITFSFKGGAADDDRRSRRVMAISLILKELQFSVSVKGDRVDARLQKYEQAEIEARLDQLGRLLQFTRQMDMLMHNDQCVEPIARSFLKGDYTLECLGRE
jgi:pyruvate, water dikinase